MLLKEKKLQQVLDITQRTGVKEKTMTCYKTISLLNIMMSEWWNSRHVGLRGLSKQLGAGAIPVSDTPFSKLMGFQSEIDSHDKLELVLSSRFMTVFFDKLLELKVAHVVAFYVIRCVSRKNNPYTSYLI